MFKANKLLVTFCVFLGLSVMVYGQEWTLAQSPEGNDVRQIFTDGNYLLISTPGAYFWSADNGDSWLEIGTSGLPEAGNFNSSWHVLGLFSGRVFAYNTYGGKELQCFDLGESNWTVCDENLGQIAGPAIFAWDTSLFLVTGTEIYSSFDNGASWISHSFSGVPETDRIQFAKELPGGTRLITTDQGVYVQAPGAGSFISASGDIGSWYKAAAEVAGNLYLMSGASLVRSADHGATWTEIVQQNDLSDIASDGTQLFLVSRREGVVKLSLDGSIRDSLLIGGTTLQIQKILIRGNAYFASSSGGLYRTNNPLGEWTRANSGIGYTGITELVAAGDTLYAATSSGIWRSLSYGQKWSPTNSVHTTMSDVATYNGKVYAASTQGVWLSADGGDSFTELKGMPQLVNPTIVAGPHGVFVSSYQGAENGTYSWNGASWQLVSSVDGSLDSWYDTTSENMYIGKFLNTGSGWSATTGMGSVGHVYSYANYLGVTFAGTFAKIAGRPILFSSPDGESFDVDVQGFDNHQETTKGLCVYGDSLIAGVYHSDTYKMYIRADGGETFSYLTENGLPDEYSLEDIVCTPFGVVMATDAFGIYHLDFGTPPAPGNEDPEIEYPPLAVFDDSELLSEPVRVKYILNNGKLFFAETIVSAQLTGLNGISTNLDVHGKIADLRRFPAGVYILQVNISGQNNLYPVFIR